jgi:DNA-binding CsgD family transcriptional regulator/PAS domain-containing protein
LAAGVAVMARSEPSLEAFSKVVEAIYDCAINPEHWRKALRLIGELTDSPCVAIGITDYTRARIAHNVEYGHDPAFWKIYLKKFAANPMFIRDRRPLGQVYTLSMLADLDEFRKSRFYDEWIKANRFGDLIGINTLRSGRRIAGLVANRKDWQPPYGEREIQLVRLLAPHACRTFAISDALDLKTISSHMLEATLDSFATGVYLIDHEGRVVYMNRAADQQVRAGKALRVVNNRLSPVSHDMHALMSHAIDEAISNEAATPSGGVSLALPDSTKGGFVATILPLNRGPRRNIFGPLAGAVAIFVQDAAGAPLYPGEAFAKLYGLTRAELRVLLAMAPGLAVKEAAAMLGIGEVTARTHLQHIFVKTGTSKQTELLQLLRNATPPVKMP